jgi:hypothetical protein
MPSTTVTVDGEQVGETFTAGALKSSGQSDTLTLKGDWAPGAHKVEVKFLNDAYGGSAMADRNLHLDAATYNGQAVAGAAASLWDAGAAGFTFTERRGREPPPPCGDGHGGADLFDVAEAGGTFTGGGGRDLYVLEAGDGPRHGDRLRQPHGQAGVRGLRHADVAAAQATEGGVPACWSLRRRGRHRVPPRASRALASGTWCSPDRGPAPAAHSPGQDLRASGRACPARPPRPSAREPPPRFTDAALGCRPGPG